MVKEIKVFIAYAIQDVTCLAQVVEKSMMLSIGKELAELQKISIHDVFSYEINGIYTDYICYNALTRGSILPYNSRKVKAQDQNSKKMKVKTQGAFNYF